MTRHTDGLTDGDDCPECHYGTLTAEIHDVGITKKVTQRVLKCNNCGFSEIQ